jgi:hypothetical protein
LFRPGVLIGCVAPLSVGGVVGGRRNEVWERRSDSLSPPPDPPVDLANDPGRENLRGLRSDNMNNNRKKWEETLDKGNAYQSWCMCVCVYSVHVQMCVCIYTPLSICLDREAKPFNLPLYSSILDFRLNVSFQEKLTCL